MSSEGFVGDSESAKLLYVPQIAYPTIIAWVIAMLLWIGSFLFLPTFVTVMIGSWATYVCFTVVHDATHKALSSKHRIVNEIFGRLAAIPYLFFPFAAFRWIHLQHHKYTNNREKDPDYDSIHAPAHMLVLNWFFLNDGKLIAYLFRGIISGELGIAVSIETIVVMSLSGYFVGRILMSDFAGVFLLNWYVPVRLTQAFLGFAFSWLPHQGLGEDGRFHNTSWVRVPGAQKVLSLLLFNQDYHLVHHMWPQIPFYRYVEAFNMKRESLAEKVCTFVFYSCNFFLRKGCV